MLHLIYQSSVNKALLQRIESTDDVIFLENASFLLRNNTQFSFELQQMQYKGARFYGLTGDLEARGINPNELLENIELIDYSAFVELTVVNKVVKTWN